VFDCQIASYWYREGELGTKRLGLGGGENFIGEGRRDDEVCIGDRYQGDTATFDVTRPRVTRSRRISVTARGFPRARLPHRPRF
jgi:MOSC domain-containing protein YiiM